MLQFIDPTILIPTQGIRNLNSDKFEAIGKNMRIEGFNPNYPIEVIQYENQYYIDNGHHRVLSSIIAGVNPMFEIVEYQNFNPGYIPIECKYDWEDVVAAIQERNQLLTA